MKNYESQSEILEKLLNQKEYRRGRRGLWYIRLCVLQTNYLFKKPKCYEKAYSTCKTALEDEFINSAHKHTIELKLIRLEKQLNIIVGRHKNIRHYNLLKPNNIIIKAKRTNEKKVGIKPLFITGKEDNPLPVELFCLEYFKMQSYNGFHSENSLFPTIFSLLFWDILFNEKEGVFETPYQNSPLDLISDAFYYDRKKEIDSFVDSMIENDLLYLNTIKKTYTNHKDKKTECIGLNWAFELEDILEICECLGSEIVTKICLLFCQDYFNRRTGFPDLCIWNYKEKLCRIIEVKGPGDKLSESQKVWIDELLRLGVKVDVCLVKEEK